jgi:hypothetical protein
VIDLPPDQRQVRGLSLRRSKRWLATVPVVRNRFQLPLIDRLGRFTGESVYTLAGTPADVLSTTIATIHSRLWRYACAHNEYGVCSPRRKDILRAAVYYTITKNSYFMDRILAILRNLKSCGKALHKTTLRFLSKCDADKRFVYGQACYNANWLIFRACKPRDKSHFKMHLNMSVAAHKTEELCLAQTAAHIRKGCKACLMRYSTLSKTTAIAENAVVIGQQWG